MELSSNSADTGIRVFEFTRLTWAVNHITSKLGKNAFPNMITKSCKMITTHLEGYSQLAAYYANFVLAPGSGLV